MVWYALFACPERIPQSQQQTPPLVRLFRNGASASASSATPVHTDGRTLLCPFFARWDPMTPYRPNSETHRTAPATFRKRHISDAETANLKHANPWVAGFSVRYTRCSAQPQLTNGSLFPGERCPLQFAIAVPHDHELARNWW
jgi:hypothetical protein